ncbi:hypothetical protein C6Y02_17135 [Bacillus sp. NMCC4]|nr:hypothetical protein C6Y02_17135 [Bacillus sp. NMCC4]
MKKCKVIVYLLDDMYTSVYNHVSTLWAILGGVELKKKGESPIIKFRAPTLEQRMLIDIVKHYNDVKDPLNSYDKSKILRMLIRKEHREIFE